MGGWEDAPASDSAGDLVVCGIGVAPLVSRQSGVWRGVENNDRNGTEVERLGNDSLLTAVAQVYSFVPIPGAQQHKRPRRRYEEIERMYKCGWNGCEKAYGTLNHLNAHVTMQGHGNKRTPEGMCVFSLCCSI